VGFNSVHEQRAISCRSRRRQLLSNPYWLSTTNELSAADAIGRRTAADRSAKRHRQGA
jgi:hypothetical protein